MFEQSVLNENVIKCMTSNNRAACNTECIETTYRLCIPSYQPITANTSNEEEEEEASSSSRSRSNGGIGCM